MDDHTVDPSTCQDPELNNFPITTIILFLINDFIFVSCDKYLNCRTRFVFQTKFYLFIYFLSLKYLFKLFVPPNQSQSLQRIEVEVGEEEDDAERERFSLATEYKLNEVIDSIFT